MSEAPFVVEYKKAYKHYKENQDTDPSEWLEFKQTFSHGKQGLVGLMTSKKDPSKKYVFKLSQYINYLIEHEYTVMKGLNRLSRFCPHYCKVYGTISCKVDPTKRKEGNPFDKKAKRKITKEVLLMEHIDKAPKLCSYINSSRIPEDILYSSIKQVLMAVSIAQQKKRLSHYDLHSDNVLMKRCDKDLVFLYVIDEKTQFLVPTHGHYPVIIDFGFSYIDDMDDDYLWASMGHTEVGFLSDRYDWVADPKLFLVSISSEIKEQRSTKKSKKLRRIVKNMFHPLSIEWDCGWDNVDDYSTSDFLTEMLEEISQRSSLFSEFEHYCIDLLQSLVILPLENRSYDNLYESYNAFLDEFLKIEDQLSNKFYLLYILQGIVNAAREEQTNYHHADRRRSAISRFRKAVYERIDEVSNFCQPRDIHFEKMLCSLLVLGKNIEGVYFRAMKEKMKQKHKEYSKLPLESTNQVFACIESNIPDTYVYNDNTTVFMFDCINEKCVPFDLNKDEVSELNSMHALSRGMYLYESRCQQKQRSRVIPDN